MSATNRGGERKPQDLYVTPPHVAAAISRWALSKMVCSPVRVLEPGCSTDAPFLSAVAERMPERPEVLYTGVELSGTSGGLGRLLFGTDYLTWEPGEDFDLIIGNPPYSLARQFLVKSFDLLRAPGMIVFLLRLPWLESKGRYRMHQICPPDYVGVIVPRPSFTGGGSDATAYAAFAYCRPMRFREPRVDWIATEEI